MALAYRKWIGYSGLLLSVTLEVPADELPNSTFAEVAAYHHVRAAQLMVQYCLKAVPTIGAELSAAYEQYESIARSVTEPLIGDAQADPMLAKLAPPELHTAISDADSSMLEAAKTLDPGETCNNTLESLRSQTPDQIRIRSKDGMERLKKLYATRRPPQ